MQVHSIENAYPKLILHDCRVIKVLREGNDYTFLFDDGGFWVMGNNQYNPHNEIFGTSGAQVRFVDCDPEFSNIYLYRQTHIFGKIFLTRRVKISMGTFCAYINQKGWQFEFVEEAYACRKAFFQGYLHFSHRPYCMECWADINCKKMVYEWNDIDVNRHW